MPVSSVPVTGNDATLTISDGAGVPLVLVIPLTNGDFKISGLNAGMKNARLTSMQEVTQFFARGKFTGAKYTKGMILEGSFSGQYVGAIGQTGTPVAADAVLKQVDWAAATSTLPPSMGDVPHFKLTWSYERSDYGGGADGSIALKYCEFSFDPSEADDGSTFTINFKAKPYLNDSIVIT